MKKKIKLTKEQIQQIKDYIKIKKLNYIDLYIETVDHIASDIEKLMNENECNFEDTFEIVKRKWNISLKKTTNVWFGFATYRPSILIKKSLKIYRPLLIKSIITVVGITLMLYVFSEKFIELFSHNKTNILSLISICLIVYIGFVLYWYVRIKLSKVNSTYSFVFNKRIVSNILTSLLFYLVFNNNYVNKDDKINFTIIALLVFLFTTFIIGNYLFKKHFEAMKMFKTIE